MRAPQGVQGGEIEETLADLWPGIAASDRGKIVELARSFREIQATPHQIRAAKAKADKSWTSPGGPEAILKHFGSLAPKPAAEPGGYAPVEIKQDRVWEIMEADRKAREAHAQKNGIQMAAPGTVNANDLAPKKKKGAK